MKSMTKLMIVAMVLAAALVVAPAAATRSGSDAQIINNGDTVYVGEDGLEFNANFGGITGEGYNVSKLIYFSGDTAGQSIPVVKGDSTTTTLSAFEVSKALIGSTTGIYYAFNDTVTDFKKERAVGTVDVRVATVDLDLVLNKTTALRVNSVNGKTVTRDTALTFEFNTNLASGFAGATGAPKMKIEVTLPGGGVTTDFQGAKLDSIPINQTSKFYYGDINLAGATAGTYTAQAKWPTTADFYGKGYDSNTVTFEVASKALSITSNKDSVVRGNPFSVTITGESKEGYRLFVKPVSSITLAEYPQMPAGQTAFNGTYNATDMGITTNAGGSATIQFNTETGTDARSYTIRVEKLSDPGNTNDEVKVRVEEGAVTVTSSGTGVYYLGEDITLSGTCTDNSTAVHLFMTGPNLDSDGVNLVTLQRGFITEDVEADDTWSYKWETGQIIRSLDAGGYTVYAVSEPVLKNNLSSTKYSTVSVQLRSGFITATTSGATVAKGDDLTISGTAQGNPDSVRLWVFGKNYYGEVGGNLYAEDINVESDGSFEEDYDTDDLASGQYFVVIEHPMGDGFGVGFNNNQIVPISGSGITAVNLTRLQASEAATALIDVLDSPNIRDTYVKLTFVVEEPNVFIDAIGDQTAGSKFTISGTTNLAVGDQLTVEVTSAAFQPSTKTETTGFANVAGTAVVQAGEGSNTWSFEVDGAGFTPDQYIVTVESIETDITQTATFNVVDGVVTTAPTGTATVAPTGTTTTATTAPTTAATPTQSPGFGALVALAGLGAVAFLVLRRN